MRDHRAFARALCRRHIRSVGRQRAVQRIHALLAAARAGAVHHAHTHIHAHVGVTIPTTRLYSVTHRSTIGSTRTASVDIRRVRLAPPSGRPAEPTWNRLGRKADATTGREPVSTRRAPGVVATRQEIRVSSVACVVPKSPPAQPAIADEHTSAPPVRFADETAPRPRFAAATPSPAELTTITNHVLSAIDQRLIARNERLGRG